MGSFYLYHTPQKDKQSQVRPCTETKSLFPLWLISSCRYEPGRITWASD